MTHLNTPQTHRGDTSVPPLPDAPIAVMDAECALCARGAHWIAKHDRSGEIRILPMQSKAGAALLNHYGMDPKDPLSWLYLDGSGAYSSLQAVVKVAEHMGGVWRAARLLNLLPYGVQDWLYARIARNRYILMGRADLCALPDPALQKRLIR